MKNIVKVAAPYQSSSIFITLHTQRLYPLRNRVLFQPREKTLLTVRLNLVFVLVLGVFALADATESQLWDGER
ncbi:hypothetical protein [Paenibacillus eucommiae]|uniref:Uncharacterized protein n=1 Tax=Paenibacillus eucommiae TaxID=1355755 RepID=A0ABS4ITN0_9BACL|nr:hypothetical protein [Paenibacillus eucommiae]MBP1990920.1 hypothetical protein [Paenibacillus eucommiae]